MKKEILEKIEDLLNIPEKYPSDKYKKNNNGDYRAFELHRYRISYLIKNTQLLLGIRHKSMQPKPY